MASRKAPKKEAYIPINNPKNYGALYGPDQNGLVRVIRKPSDASLDFYVQERIAIQMREKGELTWDVTNRAFSEVK